MVTSAPILLSLLFLHFPLSLCRENSIRPVRSANQDTADDIQFDIPDIVAEYSYQTKNVLLEAFRVRNRTRTETPKWVSVGYPTIVNNTNGQIFHFTAESITVHIKTLDQSQKQALVNQAKLHYVNENIREGNIIPLPLLQFSCTISFYVNGTNYAMRGSVYDLRSSPFSLRFPLHEGSEKRAMFEERIRTNSDPLYFECEVAATGKQERINSLKISMDQLQQVGLADKLLGPANEKYVTREQLTRVSQEVISRLDIEENYEIEGEEFGEVFIQKIIDASTTRFQPVPIDQALGQLSKYGLSFDSRDLSPNEIKRELSNVLEVKTEGSKQRIVAKSASSDSGSSSFGMEAGLSGSASALWGLAEAKLDARFAMNKANDWSRNSASLDDQLNELNRHSQSAVKWEREGTRIIPKSLNVVKVTRMTLTQQMAFSRIKKRLSNAKFTRMYEITTGVIPVTVIRPNERMHSLVLLDDHLQELNDSISEWIRNTKRETEMEMEGIRIQLILVNSKCGNCKRISKGKEKW